MFFVKKLASARQQKTFITILRFLAKNTVIIFNRLFDHDGVTQVPWIHSPTSSYP